jgi:hypothetical protein
MVMVMVMVMVMAHVLLTLFLQQIASLTEANTRCSLLHVACRLLQPLNPDTLNPKPQTKPPSPNVPILFTEIRRLTPSSIGVAGGDDVRKLLDRGSDAMVTRHTFTPSHPHTSHLTPHTSHLTPRTSHLTPSHLAPRTSHLTPHTLTLHTSLSTGSQLQQRKRAGAVQ